LDNIIVVSHQPLTRFAASILEASRVPPSTASIVAESLVAANLRAVDSHGIQLLLWYTDQIRAGNVAIDRSGRVASENGACLVYDGQNGIGQLISTICCDHANRLAREHGIGLVVARNSTHFGAAAWWAQRISVAGYIGISMCNATALVAPWQGRDRMLGTNPICMSVPGPDTFLLDMATTTVALNKIYKAVLSGEKTIPAGWAMDREGNPTTDALIARDGLPMPLGGYKGTGLAVMVEILCAVLSGGAMLTDVGGIHYTGKEMRASHMFLAIDVTRFMPVEEFSARMKWVRDTLKTSAPAAGFDEVLVAGEPEWRAEAIRRRDGIPVARGIWDELGKLAASLGVVVPEISV
jgi:LDH2 family malate/lactate/ureidoglycolate dehydrogenase